MSGPSLMSNPGTQLQGINQQGLQIEKDFVEVSLTWVDGITGLPFDPTTYSCSITYNGSPYTLQKELTPMSRADDAVGVWVHCFLTTGMQPGNYLFTYVGSTPTNTTVTKTITISAAEIPVEMMFVNSLRSKLGDSRSSRYLVDDNMRTRWTQSELYGCVYNSLMQVGQAPPAPSIITWEQAFAECYDQVLTGGFIQALEARGIFETFNAFSYSDELSLGIDRKVLFQNAQSLRQQWWNSVLAWKRDGAFRSMRGGIGLGSGRFPLYMSRAISLSLASSQVMFNT